LRRIRKQVKAFSWEEMESSWICFLHWESKSKRPTDSLSNKGTNGWIANQRKLFWKLISKICLTICMYSQTCANDHLRKTTTCLQRPPFWSPIFTFYNIKQPLNKNHLSTTATIFGSRGWSLYTGLTVHILHTCATYRIETGIRYAPLTAPRHTCLCLYVLYKAVVLNVGSLEDRPTRHNFSHFLVLFN